MTDETLPSKDTSHPPPPPWHRNRRRLAAAALLVGGLAVGSGLTAVTLGGRSATLVALQPAPIAQMQPWSAVAAKGEVAEIFGGKFILQDASGRALVETGPRGDDGGLVAAKETVTVQGRFDNGSIHAMAVTHADGRTDMLGPPGPGGRHGPLVWLDRHGMHLPWHGSAPVPPPATPKDG